MAEPTPSPVTPKEYYTRPLLLFGSTWMKSITTMQVLVVGLRGVGVDIVRTLLGHGLKSVTIHDDDCVCDDDVASHPVYARMDVGRKKSSAVKDKLSGIAPSTVLLTLSGTLTSELLLHYHAVVFSSGPMSREEIVGLSEFCHAQTPPIAVVVAESRGLLGSVFVDFGPHHMAMEDESAAFTVVQMDVGAGNVVVQEQCVHLMLQPGDLVEFAFARQSGTDGVTSDLTWLDRRQFSIAQVAPPSTVHVNFGVSPLFVFDLTQHSRLRVKRVRGSRAIHHTSFRENIIAPRLVHGPNRSSSNEERPAQLHAIMQGLYAYRQLHGFFPQSNNVHHALEILSLTRDFIAKTTAAAQFGPTVVPSKPVPDVLVHDVARVASTEFAPLSALVAGLACRELVKFCGFGCPVSQLLYLDLVGILPKDFKKERVFHDPAGLSSDSNAMALFGRAAVDRLRDARVVVVGCGSVGCQVVENLTRIGVKNGVMVDGGRVKRQDLATQCGYRDADVGSNKAHALQVHHPSWTAIPLHYQQSQSVHFNEAFWQPTDVVVTTVDANHTTLLLDDECFLYSKPFVLGQSHGLKAFTQSFAPHVTERWAESKLKTDPASTSLFLLDRLAIFRASISPSHKSLPHHVDHATDPTAFEIDHIVQWARAVFDNTFHQSLVCLRAVWTDKVGASRAKRRDPAFIQLAHDAYDRYQALTSISACVAAAQFFLKAVLAPHGIALSTATHGDLVAVAAVLFGRTVSTLQPTCRDVITAAVAPSAQPALSQEAFQAMTAIQMQSVVDRIRPTPCNVMDDANMHVHFVQLLANTVAAVHGIAPASFFCCKAMCGCRADSLATATIVGALAAIEATKILFRKPTALRSCEYVGSSGSLHFHTPRPPAVMASTSMDRSRGMPLRICPENMTLWHKVVIQCTDIPRLITVEDILRHLKALYEVHVERLTCHNMDIYAANDPTSLKSNVFETCAAVSHAVPMRKPRTLLVTALCKDHDSDVILPPILLLAPPEINISPSPGADC
ncbi:hypothetical protein H310_05960 [Aphanomyces invadans]|uniref:THIF-type NAD/FAD binding fold domain-containing protein n=1 Tax=Aphanomyces invadans TaxID=157072 RepID=A0A024U7Q9_9STRA|nr:hypothetical protein H310_05960 [Aphanomyces invadans]ETW02451.1 hypothetical protein H310_05960 [Aphanomyces invadans]|eukprot:XP_008869056.1 hypothetical protein H310_05960 [Aphanomyces invadans]